MAVVAKGEITLLALNDAFSVVLSPNSCVIRADFDGANPKLSTAYTNITVIRGKTLADFTLKLKSTSNPAIQYSIIDLGSMTRRIQISALPTDILSGCLEFELQSLEDFITNVTFQFSVVRESSMLDWVRDWESSKTQIGDTYLITPKIFVGNKIANSDGLSTLTGVYIGPDSNLVGAPSAGVYGYKEGKEIFHINETGGLIGGWGISSKGIQTTDGVLKILSEGSIIASGPHDILWGLYKSGEASFAKGNVLFHQDGSASFKGHIESASGTFGGWTATATAIHSSRILLDSDSNYIGVCGADVGLNDITATSHKENVLINGGVYIHYTSRRSFGISGHLPAIQQGEAQIQRQVFTMGAINKIACWNFDEKALYIGTLTTTGFTAESGDLTLSEEGIRGYGWRLETDGSGELAGGDIQWNVKGSVDVKGSFMLSTGGDVRTMFEIMEGMLRSAIQSVTYNFSEEDNFFTNATFTRDMESWEHESEIELYSCDGLLLDIGINFLSHKNNVSEVVEFDGRQMLRLKDGFIRQRNEFIRKPGAGSVMFLNFRYKCISSGQLKIGFENTPEGSDFSVCDILLNPNQEYKIVEIEGTWDGSGDFYLNFTGDIYIELLGFANKPLEDYKREVNTLFEQTDKYIKAVATDVNKLDNYVKEAGWITTADGNKLWATHKTVNDLEDMITTHSGEFHVTADAIKGIVTRIDEVKENFTHIDKYVRESGWITTADGTKLWATIERVNLLGESITTHSGEFHVTAEAIKGMVSRLNTIDNTIDSAGWITTADGNKLWASHELEDGDKIISYINQTATTVTIKAQRIKLEGLVTANQNFKIFADGSIEAKNGKFTGEIDTDRGFIGGFEIANGRIGAETSAPGSSGGSLAIYDNFFRVGGNGGYVMFGNDVMPGYLGGGTTAVGRIVNDHPDQGGGWMTQSNYGIFIDVTNAHRNYGIWSNAAIAAPAFINTRFKELTFSGGSYDIDFSQFTLFMLKAATYSAITLPSQSSVNRMFGFSTMPRDFGCFVMFKIRTGSQRIILNNIYNQNEDLTNHEMAPGDSVILAVSNMDGFRYNLLNTFL